MTREPARRKDNRCAQCRRPLPEITRAMRKYAGDQLDRDPFCSSDCCREWHRKHRGIEFQEHTPRPTETARRISKWSGAEEIRQRRERIKREGLPPGHAESAANYKNGCRCDGCRASFSKWQRAHRARKKVAA